MVVELRKKAQITLPKKIVDQLNLYEGDKFEISVKNGIIMLEPVAVYPKEYINKLAKEIRLLKEDSNYKDKGFDNVEDLIKYLKQRDKSV